MPVVPYPEHVYDPSPEDPVGVCAPFLPAPPDWVLIGGLGDVMEGAQVRKRWPKCMIVGVDPDQRAVMWQRENGWPADAELLTVALSNRSGFADIRMDSICCPSMHPANVAEAKPGEMSRTSTITLDYLWDAVPLNGKGVLWLDLEGWEFYALVGAAKLLESGRVTLVCTEVWYKHEADARRVSTYLETMGYERVYVWFRQWWGHNEFWMRRDRHDR